MNPRFSPDGKKVVFSSFRSGNQEVWIADADGSNAIQITQSQGSGSPNWALDGRSIVFDTRNTAGGWDIAVVDPAGGEPKRLAPGSAPSLSRDGKWIYFTANRNDRGEVFRIAVQGGEPIRVTDNGGGLAEEWIDGGSVYYMRSAPVVGCAPLLVRSSQGGPERQVADAVCSRGFAVRPQGIYYAAPGDGDGEYEVHRYDPASGVRTTVSKLPADFRPGHGITVSPDGQTILITAGVRFGSDLMLVENFR